MSHRGTHCANIRTNVGLSHFFQSLFIAMFEVFSSSVLRRKNRKKIDVYPMEMSRIVIKFARLFTYIDNHALYFFS